MQSYTLDTAIKNEQLTKCNTLVNRDLSNERNSYLKKVKKEYNLMLQRTKGFLTKKNQLIFLG